MVMGALSASLTVDKWIIMRTGGRLKGEVMGSGIWDLILTSSLDVVHDVCDGRSIAARKGLSTGQLGMFKERGDGKGRVLFGFGKDGLAMTDSNEVK